MADRPLYIVSWSGGKDSTATIILAHEHGLPLDRIVISLPWFDKERKIYADDEDHVNWVLNYAKPMFESWGYRVDIVSDDRDYLYWFFKVKEKSKYPEQNGLLYGFVIAGMCKMNQSKVEPIAKYVKALGCDHVMYEGIAADEEARLIGMHQTRGHESLMEKYGKVESDAYPICCKYGLLSPVYKKRKRQGCWFCPNQSIEEMADTKVNRPHLWNRLAELAKVEGTATRGFKYGQTFEQIDAQVDQYIANPPPEQLSFFDFDF